MSASHVIATANHHANNRSNSPNNNFTNINNNTRHDNSINNCGTSLVLGSGGAKGLAQIGVIEYLNDNGFDIGYIAGSSIGALIGGIYAADQLPVYVDWVRALQRKDVVRLLDWSFDTTAVFKGDRIIGVLKELIGERNIEDLSIGYTAVATDLAATTGASREVWLNAGPLFDAIRASMAVPTLFAPVHRDGRVLVDGGVVNPVPVAPTLNHDAPFTIAVDLNGAALPSPGLCRQNATADRWTAGRRQGISGYLDRLLPGSANGNAMDGVEPLRFSDVATRSMEAMQATITQLRLAAATPSATVSIPRNLCGFFDFHRAAELIDYGYAAAEQALADLTPESAAPVAAIR